MKAFGSLTKQAFRQWLDDNAQRLGAALAFYTSFSLAPLLVLVIAAAGFLTGQKAAQTQLIAQMNALIGRQGAQAVNLLLEATRRPRHPGTWATVLGVITLLAGAAGGLFELQDGLNHIWKVPEPGGWAPLLRRRILLLVLFLGIAFLLLVSLFISTFLAILGQWLNDSFSWHPTFWQLTDFVLSSGVVTVLFALIYKLLPEVSVRWKDVWIGSAVASILFTVGKFLVALYISKSAVASTYGAAGSLAVVLLWVYYSTLILYYGAEFTKVCAGRYGSRA